MWTRTYEERDSDGNIIEQGQKGWWNNIITMSNLAPNPAVGISGMVSAQGGWCKLGDCKNPDKKVTLQSSASRWAEMLAEELGVTKAGVIQGISTVLERLETERIAALNNVDEPPVSPE